MPSATNARAKAASTSRPTPSPRGRPRPPCGPRPPSGCPRRRPCPRPLRPRLPPRLSRVRATSSRRCGYTSAASRCARISSRRRRSRPAARTPAQRVSLLRTTCAASGRSDELSARDRGRERGSPELARQRLHQRGSAAAQSREGHGRRAGHDQARRSGRASVAQPLPLPDEPEPGVGRGGTAGLRRQRDAHLEPAARAQPPLPVDGVRQRGLPGGDPPRLRDAPAARAAGARPSRHPAGARSEPARGLDPSARLPGAHRVRSGRPGRGRDDHARADGLGGDVAALFRDPGALSPDRLVPRLRRADRSAQAVADSAAGALARARRPDDRARPRRRRRAEPAGALSDEPERRPAAGAARRAARRDDPARGPPPRRHVHRRPLRAPVAGRSERNHGWREPGLERHRRHAADRAHRRAGLARGRLHRERRAHPPRRARPARVEHRRDAARARAGAAAAADGLAGRDDRRSHGDPRRQASAPPGSGRPVDARRRQRPRRPASGGDLDAHVPARRRCARRAMGAAHGRRCRQPARRPHRGASGLRFLSDGGGARMTAVLADRAPTTAEHEQSPLVLDLEQIRRILEALRDGVAPPPVSRAPADDEFEPAVDRVARLFGLSAFERQVLLLAAAVELDGDVAALAATVQNSGDPRPTFGLALAALPTPHWDAVAPDAPLRRWRLLEPGPGPTLASRALRIDERVLHYVTGIEAADERLEGVLRVAAGPAALAPSQRRLAGELARTAAGAGARVLVRVEGEDGDAQLGVAQAFAEDLGRIALVVRGSALPAAGPELAALARLVDREALLLEGLPVVATQDAHDPTVAALLDALEAPLVAIVGDSPVRTTGRVAMHRSVHLPAPAEARLLWTAALGEPLALADPVEEVAQHFRLSAAAIDAVAREFAATATARTDAAAELRRLCRERSRVRLEGLAERIDPAATWNDLVLPDGHIELLREIVRHVRHRTQVYERWGFGERTTRGLGVTALFSGESGTGKTLAAEVLAHELGLDLYRIDLATTVSKYIGETEKNLRRVFAAAEASGAVLLFDEADALFGKRGEVKDAHDRYANLEVAYLLQRMESYRGLAILTTNLRSNVDRAFLRRLRFVVSFPFPTASQRAEIWRRTFPPATPLEGVDAGDLAGLVVSGGTIRSIALSAAFAAAEDGTAVLPAHVLRAAQVEYAKAERALTDKETEGLR